jgi:hypothetical protein
MPPPSDPYGPLRHWASRPHWASEHPTELKLFRQGLGEARDLPGFTRDGLERFIRTETRQADLHWSTRDAEKAVRRYLAIADEMLSD